MSFHVDGYVHLPWVFADRVPVLRAAAETIRTTDSPWVGPWHEGPSSLRVGWKLHTVTPIWNAAVVDPFLLDVVQGLLGTDDVRVEHTTLLLKPAGSGAPFPWHQDSTYYRNEGWRYLMAQVYLDDVTPDNGSLQVVPGSHLHGALPHVHLPRTKLHLSAETMATLNPPVLIPAAAGDVVVFDQHCVHGSAANRSDAPRLAVRIMYLGKA